MATFTTVSKQRLSWQAPADLPNVFLKIDDTHYFLIDNEHKLIISRGGITPVNWTNTNKSR